MANRLVIDGLTAGYGAVTVLREISLEIRAGELVGGILRLHPEECPKGQREQR